MSMNSPPPQETVYDGPPRQSGCLWIAVGCGVLSVALLVALILGGYYFAHQGKQVVADAVVKVAINALRQSELPEVQQARLVSQIDNLVQGFKAGEITLEQLGEIVERLVDNNTIVAAGLLYVVEHHVLDEVELSPDVRQDAHRAVQRLARGVVEEKIEMKALETAAEPLLEIGPDGRKELKSDLSGDEIQQLIDTSTQLADQAEIPDEPFEIDIAAEFDSLVKDVLSAPAE